MRLVAAVLTAALAIPNGRSAAAEKHFALFFAFEDAKNHPESSHTFIEFIRADVQPNAAPVILQRDVISWLPANGVVRIHALRAEEGRNYSLNETLAIVDSRCRKLKSWGPYEMSCRAYQLALERKAELESGSVLYKFIDVTTFANRSANCVHGAAEIDAQARRIGEYNVKYGDAATIQVIRHYVRRGYLCNPCTVREDVFQVLGFEGRCMDRRNDWDVKVPFRWLWPKLACR